MQEQELVNAIAKLVVEQLKNVDVCDPKDRFRWAFPRHVHLSQQILRPCSEKAMNCIKRKILWAGSMRRRSV